ncbi:MAG: hypothetical protein H6518_13475 [Microthrixaceae bacterium]|nr:hypothetical protein [Microthrixaceae bacterium]
MTLTEQQHPIRPDARTDAEGNWSSDGRTAQATSATSCSSGTSTGTWGAVARLDDLGVWDDAP